MTALRVPPGRAGMLLLRRRLAFADAGVVLLTHKLTMLAAERTRLAASAQEAERRWQDAGVRAQRWLLRAAMLDGERGVRLASLPPSATAAYLWTNLMGLRYPDASRCTLPVRGPADPPFTSGAVFSADAHVRAAVPLAAEHAAAQRALQVVDREAALTRQRLRALEHRWIPRLRTALATARAQVDELENADAVRRRWAAQSGTPRPAHLPSSRIATPLDGHNADFG